MNTARTDPCGPIGRAPIRPESVAAKLKAIRNYELPEALEQISENPRLVELLVHLQAMSLRPGGLLKFVEELLAEFPERIGPPTLRTTTGKRLTFEQKRDILFQIPSSHWPAASFIGPEPCGADELLHPTILDADQLAYFQRENGKRLREALGGVDGPDFAAICRNAALSRLPDYLAGLCSDKATGFARLPQRSEGEVGGSWPLLCRADRGRATWAGEHWFFDDVLGAVLEMMDRQAAGTQKRLAMTEVARQVFETLDYALTESVMVRIEGNSRFGKTESLQAWAEARPGLARLVRVPSDNSMDSFFKRIGEALGMDCSYGSRPTRLKERIEFVVQHARPFLIFDEGAYLLPQVYTATTQPHRLNWVRDAIVDRGLPVAIAVTPTSFKTDLARFVKRTAYTMEQFVGRTFLSCVLPDVLSEKDLIAVARIHFPELSENALGYIANEARLSEAYLHDVEALARYARFLAGRNGGKVTTKILEAAVAKVMLRQPPAEAPARRQAPLRMAPEHALVKAPLRGSQRDMQPPGLGLDLSNRSLRGAGPERMQAEPVLAES